MSSVDSEAHTTDDTWMFIAPCVASCSAEAGKWTIVSPTLTAVMTAGLRRPMNRMVVRAKIDTIALCKTTGQARVITVNGSYFSSSFKVGPLLFVLLI